MAMSVLGVASSPENVLIDVLVQGEYVRKLYDKTFRILKLPPLHSPSKVQKRIKTATTYTHCTFLFLTRLIRKLFASLEDTITQVFNTRIYIHVTRKLSAHLNHRTMNN